MFFPDSTPPRGVPSRVGAVAQIGAPRYDAATDFELKLFGMRTHRLQLARLQGNGLECSPVGNAARLVEASILYCMVCGVWGGMVPSQRKLDRRGGRSTGCSEDGAMCSHVRHSCGGWRVAGGGQRSTGAAAGCAERCAHMCGHSCKRRDATGVLAV